MRRPLRLSTCLAAGALVLLVAVPATMAVSLEESRKGLYGSVVDEQDKPIVGITILLSASPDMTSPMKVKTTDRGFVYPRLSEQPASYYLRIESDEWFIRKYRIKVRRPSGELFQDDEGHLIPGAENRMPPVKWRVGNATVEFTLVKMAEYKAAQVAAAGQGQVQQQITVDQQVQEMVAMGDYKGAADKLAKTIEENPADADRRWQHAVILSRAGESQAAIREAQKALALKPDMKGVRLPLADWLNDLGRTDEAIAALEKEREVDAQNPAIYKGLAMLYDGAGRKADSEQAVGKWVELAPDDTEALLNQARIKAGKGDYAGAEELYRKVAEKDPANAYRAFYNVAATIWARRGDVNVVVAALQKSIELKPDFPKSQKLMGDCLLNQGKLAEAREHYERFVALAPGDPDAAEIKKLLAGLPKK